MFKRMLKNERGLTLIELLAVIVILGIVAAIAIPAIGGLIDNSKKDAHVSNAQQMINAAKIAVTADKDLIPANGKYTLVTLEYLEDKGYLETVKDPDGGTNSYEKGTGAQQMQTGLSSDPKADYSYVLIKNNNNKLSYFVKLINNERGVHNSGAAVEEQNLKRSVVGPATTNNASGS
ncbi:prepilin-type N-terminal cleavage/methylation domain-containing protein [Geobacillus zalihae]|uniref:prepilin-type N-terminal cleavage/methylation domain-containing protein n=1 Tax=Geobacillus TaxID=129337 RepID=UPI0010134FBB|nr:MULTISPECIES: prepilin-type N-terminal cleavage/methylation domain-containing protein [Geobacillus]RXS86217.1 type II secretion system protein [Geobacillus sp. PK12]WKA46662.1 prepilin-type N-terminal cleavage/methylation domain-containing protein [Geobacillus zalihae]